MEVVASPSSGGGSPFQHRDVREWSRLDSITGVLERARLETDHWAASAAGQKHQYGKVVDSRARTGVEGSLQQRRQLEVFQSQVPGGRLQVVRTHTVASRSWSSSNSTGTTTVAPAAKAPSSDFENLQLAVNPLDLSSQKSKASVGRSGGRRPPTRPRLREDAAKSLHRVSRLCHQLHEEAVQKTFKCPLITERRESGDGSPAITYENETTNSNESDEIKQTNGHSNLGRTKSNSSEDLHKRFESTQDDINDFDQLENWRRTSKLRRSWQFPKQAKPLISSRPPDLPVNTGSVRKIKEDLETGRRLNTALRGNNVDLDALDQILQSISSSSSIYSDIPSPNETPERDTNNQVSSLKKQKKSAFITVESLQAVRGRLKPLSSPVYDIISTFENKTKDEEIDDGIETEESNVKSSEEMTTSEMPTSRVRSYVYGMEAMLNRKPVSGTGSLESRSSNKSSGSGGSRTEDWYNRRNSYGFEAVHNQQEQNNSMALKSKSKVESSTDSGICRSTEIVVIPPDVKNDSDLEPDHNEKYRYGKISSVQVNRVSKETSLFSTQKTKDDVSAFVISFKDGSQTMDANWKQSQREIEPGTITIPITSDSSILFDSEKRFFESNKENNNNSIAVDDSKYAPRAQSAESKALLFSHRRPNLVLNDAKYGDNMQDALDDEASIFNKKQKKVEFCKTEVHFAAESGRVNIVETDEKPPPTNNFRRRRRNSGVTINQLPPEDVNRNGLPMLHFGDSTYEKTLFGVSDPSENADTAPQSESASEPESQFEPKSEYMESSAVTVNSQSNTSYSQNLDDEFRDLTESEIQIRGILKNKPVKPKPYHLGENDDHLNGISSSDDQENKWGVKLRPVQREESRMWRSTVTLRSNTFDSLKEASSNTSPEVKQSDTESDANEIQQLLKSLKPTRKYSEPMEINTSNNSIGVKISSVPGTVLEEEKPVNLSSSWTVADRVKQVEDMHWTENKGYSTKVNFGGGEATVVENNAQEFIKPERYTTWPRKEETPNHDRKQTSILNKGLVVRIGHDTMCSKTTTNHDNTTTTTKITIDLSPSPTNNTQPVFKSVKLPRATLHSLKSTSLIMNTFSKTDNDTTLVKKYQRDETQLQNGFKPWKSDKESAVDQLAALRRLYDDADQSDSEKADEEVRSYMSGLIEENGLNEIEDDTSSVVSGSWSKMRAYKNMKQHLQNQSKPLSFTSDSINDKRLEKDFVNLRISTENTTCSSNKKSHEVTETFNKKVYVPTKQYKCDLKSAATNEKLSSPSLVGQNAMGNNTATKKKPTISDISKYFVPQQKNTSSITTKPPTQERSQLLTVSENSNNIGRASSFTAVSSKIKTIMPKHQNVLRYPSKSELAYFGVSVTPPTPTVLRYPRKSELAYFGVSTTPKSNTSETQAVRKVITEKRVVESKSNLAENFKSSFAPVVTPLKPKYGSHVESPIYENIENVQRDNKKITIDYRKKDYDSSIMDDLNNAANEILQAVNGYSQEESQLSEEERMKPEKLETISETKSWKQTSPTTHDTRETRRGSLTQNKIRHSSSNSSIDSITKEYRRTTQSSSLKQRSRVETTQTTSSAEKQKKKITSVADPALSKATKARRLQRASSREALLQSHGSSSEDLSKNVETPVRKPRLVRRSKTHTNGVSTETVVATATPKKSTMSQTSFVRKRDIDIPLPSERLPGAPLPEIRHKTTITTIKSTAEKQALREAKAQKLKLEDQKRNKKITTTRKDFSSSKTVTSPPSTAHRTKVASTATAMNARDGTRNTGANIKKSTRTEGMSRR